MYIICVARVFFLRGQKENNNIELTDVLYMFSKNVSD